MRTSFILHLDSLVILEEMTNEQKGILFDAIYKFNLGQEVELDFAMKMAFTPFKNQFIRDGGKYDSFVEKQKENGKKGGRPKKVADNQSNTINPTQPTKTQETQAFLGEPKKAYKDSVSDNDSVKESKKDNIFKWGDGVLESMCNEFKEQNKDKYPDEMYENFLEYWTAPLQTRGKTGKELWRDEKTFQLSARLRTSYDMIWSKKQTGSSSQTVKQNYNSRHGITSN